MGVKALRLSILFMTRDRLSWLAAVQDPVIANMVAYCHSYVEEV